MSKLGPDHYRYVDEIGPKGVAIVCETYIVSGETPACWYVLHEDQSYLLPGNVSGSFWEASYKKARKRILKYEGGKKFCYPTREAALKSYTIRKRWQLKHTENAFQRAKTALAEVTERLKGVAPEGKHVCEGGEYFKQKCWDYC